ncbi:hypothetical protein L3Q82_016534 [Scortum barcoo]|uniref:Uncharacterized protein n=1 Tax=Scortum barcoo TaxID=214431 RepID=A0ACB8X7P2_9TELE|nr:hypothetical protein L3Q82_016534 [Scortum barcoo]
MESHRGGACPSCLMLLEPVPPGHLLSRPLCLAMPEPSCNGQGSQLKNLNNRCMQCRQTAAVSVPVHRGDGHGEKEGKQDEQGEQGAGEGGESEEYEEDNTLQEEFCSELPQVSTETNSRLAEPLRLCELQAALQSMQGQRAPGIDGLTVGRLLADLKEEKKKRENERHKLQTELETKTNHVGRLLADLKEEKKKRENEQQNLQTELDIRTNELLEEKHESQREVDSLKNQLESKNKEVGELTAHGPEAQRGPGGQEK